MSALLIEVSTFGRYAVQRIPMPRSGKSGDALTALGKELSLKPSSLQCFSLFVGHLGIPVAWLDPADSVKGVQPLCLQRYGLYSNKELKLLATDDVAVHLLFSEALASYRSSPSRLEPTEDQSELLEEYLDPNFLSERQFLETVINVKGYTTIQISNAKVTRTAIKDNSITLPIDCPVACTCSEDHLELKGPGDHLCIRWNWKKIRRWKLEEAGKVASFEVTNTKGNAHILEFIYIESQQAKYLLQMAKLVCTNLVYLKDPTKRPIEGPPGILVGRPMDPLYNFVNSALFGTGPEFTTLSANQ